MTKYKFEDIAYNSTQKKKPVENDKYTYIGLEHIDPRCLQIKRFGSDVAPKGEKLIMKKGDILFGKRRAYQKKVAIAPFDGIFSAHGLVLRPKEDIITKDFFPFFISSDYFLDAAIKISVGSLSPTINWSSLKELEFNLPSLEKQKELAELLWAAEETKQAYKKLLQKTDDMVKAKFEELCLRLPTNINKLSLGKFIKVRTGKLDANASEPNGIYPFFTCSKKILKINQYSFDCECVLLAGNGELNVKYYCGKFDAYQRTYVIETIDPHILSTKYLYYFMKKHLTILQSSSIGGVIKYIKLENITDAKIYIPDINLQNNFTCFADKAEQTKQKLQKSLDVLEDTMRSLINENLN